MNKRRSVILFLAIYFFAITSTGCVICVAYMAGYAGNVTLYDIVKAYLIFVPIGALLAGITYSQFAQARQTKEKAVAVR